MGRVGRFGGAAITGWGVGTRCRWGDPLEYGGGRCSDFKTQRVGEILESYANLSGASAVRGYEIGQGSITVQFRDGSIYVYTNASAGPVNIAEMQRLAKLGQGLNSFISRFVKKNYAQKLR